MLNDGNEWMSVAPRPTVDLHTDRPHSARVYDVLLGGKTNYAADREQAAKVVASLPAAVTAAKANRSFMHRVVRYLVAEVGVRQFLDVGTGIPTSPNLHEVAQAVNPSARVVYSDNDPIVLAHSRALHISNAEGRTAYIEADATRPETILDAPALRETIDLDEPVALVLCLLLHWLPPSHNPYATVRTLMDALPVGSALVVSHVAKDVHDGISQVEEDFEGTGSSVRARTREQVAEFFTGLDLLDPGILLPHQWRPDHSFDIGTSEAIRPADVPIWAGVGLKTS